MNEERVAVIEAMATAVLSDLLDRRGIKNILRDIKDNDPETWQEICDGIGTAALDAMLALSGKTWKIVPVEATVGMVAEAWASALAENAVGVWEEMLAAAPNSLADV
jgi:predicted solute-binding protein